jgi:hypothetical protein
MKPVHREAVRECDRNKGAQIEPSEGKNKIIALNPNSMAKKYRE